MPPFKHRILYFYSTPSFQIKIWLKGEKECPSKKYQRKCFATTFINIVKYTFGKGRILARSFAAIHGDLFFSLLLLFPWMKVCFSLFEVLKTQWRKIKQMLSVESFFFPDFAFSLDTGCRQRGELIQGTSRLKAFSQNHSGKLQRVNSFFWEENHTRIYIGLHLTSRFWWFWCLCWEIFHHEGEWSLFLHIYSRLHISTYLYVFKATVCYDKEMCAESTFFLYEATSRLPAWRWIIFFGKCSHQNNGPRIVCLHHPKIIWKETKYPNIAPLFCLSVFQNIRKVWIFAMNEEKGTADSFLNRKFLESASQTHIVSKQIAQNCRLICFVECGRR